MKKILSIVLVLLFVLSSFSTVSEYDRVIALNSISQVEIVENGELVSSISVNVGESYSSLSCEPVPTNGTVEWSSGDTSIATVNESGVITGVHAGAVSISIMVTDTSVTPNNVFTDTITVFVTIPDGVYAIKNARSGKSIDVYDGSSEPQTNVIQWSMHSNTAPNQVWKTTYIGEGKYFIQSGLDFDIGLYRTSTGNVCIEDVIKPETIEDINESSIWTISYINEGNNDPYYVVCCNGDLTKTLTVENNSVSSGASIITNTYDNTDPSCKWEFVNITDPPVTGIRFASFPKVNGYSAVVVGQPGMVDVEVFPAAPNNINLYWDLEDENTADEVHFTSPHRGFIIPNEQSTAINTTNKLTVSFSYTSTFSCSEEFDIIPFAPDVYSISSVEQSNKQMDVSYGKARADNSVVLYNTHHPITANQSWTLEYAGNYNYKIRTRLDENYILGTKFPLLTNATVRINDEATTPDSTDWKFIYNDNNNYYIYNARDGYLTAELSDDTYYLKATTSLANAYSFNVNLADDGVTPQISIQPDWVDDNGDVWLCNNDVVTFEDDANSNVGMLWESNDPNKIKFSIANRDDSKVLVFHGDNGEVSVTATSNTNSEVSQTQLFKIAPITDLLESPLKIQINGAYKYLTRDVISGNPTLTNYKTSTFTFDYISAGYYVIKDSNNYALTLNNGVFSFSLLSSAPTDYQLWRIHKIDSGYSIAPKNQNDRYVGATSSSIVLSADENGSSWEISMVDYHLTMVDEADKRDRLSGYVNGADGLTSNPADINMVNMIYHDNITAQEFISLLEDTEGVVAIRTHGGEDHVYTSGEAEKVYASELGDVNASVVLYGACLCGSGGAENPDNLVNVTIEKAEACGNDDIIVVGFLYSVSTTDANTLMEQFIKYTRSGMSYEAAISWIYDNSLINQNREKQLYISGIYTN